VRPVAIAPAAWTCPVCGAHAFRFNRPAATSAVPRVYRITERAHPNCWAVFSCTGCGLGRADWKFSQETLREMYTEMRDEVYDEQQRCRQLTFARGLQLLERFRPPGRLLDAGCATGGFVAEAAARGWTAEGVDLSRWAVRRARARGLSVSEGDVRSVDLPLAAFDAVSLLDVLEHDSRPRELLERIHSLLRPDGCIYLTTPDAGSAAARAFGQHWWGMNPMHLWYFSRATLRTLVTSCGFDVIAMRSYTRVFALRYWAERLAHLHPTLARLGVGAVDLTRIGDVAVPLNLGDMLEVTARKAMASSPPHR
jgi:SAM-dependent methyltransferase